MFHSPPFILKSLKSQPLQSLARVEADGADPNEGVAKAPDALARHRVVEIQAMRGVPLHLAQELALASPVVSSLAVKDVPQGTGLVDRVAGIIHGDHVQVKGVVSVVQITRAIQSVSFHFSLDVFFLGNLSYQSLDLYSLALGRAAEVRPTLVARARTKLVVKYMLSSNCL